MVLVRLHGVIRELAGTSALEIDAKSTAELLQRLPEGIKLVMERYRGYIAILVNGRRIYEGSDRVLERSDIVDITLLVSGG